MYYYFFNATQATATTAILCKSTSFVFPKIKQNYTNPLVLLGVQTTDLVAVSLAYQTATKCSAVFAKEYLDMLLPNLLTIGVTTLFVTDAFYFKQLTGLKKTTFAYGSVHPCVLKGYQHFQIIIAPSYSAIIFNPSLQHKLNLSIKTLHAHMTATSIALGTGIIHAAEYPVTELLIEQALEKLHQYPSLTCDTETRGLKFYNCGLSTIGFAWDQHNGIAFPVDIHANTIRIKELLRNFFNTYTGTIIYHNAAFDTKILVYSLWMQDLGDYVGLLKGLSIICKNIHDTKLIAYLALNNTVETILKLKVLAFEFAGDYGQEDIEHTELIPLPQLLEYNLKDCLCTWYIYNKYYPQMIQDKQETIYQTIFRPGIKSILQMELCGMPIDPIKVQQLKQTLKNSIQKYQAVFQTSLMIQAFHLEQLEEKAAKATAKAKKKIYTIDDPVIAFDFNPNSDNQLRKLIYDYMGYEPIDFTKKKAPATGTKTLIKLIQHATNQTHIDLFNNLVNYTLADKILTSFIPHFEQAQQLPDGSYRLYGNFNQGGTKSGRQSSSAPNLQNLPATSIYGKAVKECFISPPGWLFAGSDYDSLEDKVNALITHDPNKQKVYTDGYDGHCLRAFAYFNQQMPDIQNTIKSINSIKTRYASKRQDSKAPTFALTYHGTYITLMKNCGFTEEMAKNIEANYKKLYTVAIQWVNNHLDQAIKTGYVTCAFGLRLRTPILAQTIVGGTTPFIAQKERRSAGNAVSGQSYGLLTTRAGIEFQERCLASKYKYDILPTAQIHDALYYLIKNKPDVVEWANTNLIECMAWQQLPELQHPQIKLSSGLDVFWPNWSKAVGIPNNATKQQLIQIAKEK